jgi:ubiquinone/menaquinone biosynthesis C-methylase UbiE
MTISETSYLYDLYLVPGWCELFDRMIEQEVQLPKEGRILELGCGTGGLAIDLALRGEGGREVVAIDADPAMIALAQGKASIHKPSGLTFLTGTLETLALPPERFDLLIADFSLTPWRQAPCQIEELLPLARKGATLVLKLATRGSFDEFFSLYWEALYHLGLSELSPALEALIEARLSVTDAERWVREAGWHHVKSLQGMSPLTFPDAATLFDSPLLQTVFLDSWLDILPDESTRDAVTKQISQILDQERQGGTFDLSVKTTLLVARK